MGISIDKSYIGYGNNSIANIDRREGELTLTNDKGKTATVRVLSCEPIKVTVQVPEMRVFRNFYNGQWDWDVLSVKEVTKEYKPYPDIMDNTVIRINGIEVEKGKNIDYREALNLPKHSMLSEFE